MLRKKTGLIFIYKFILVEMVINMFVYNSLHYFLEEKCDLLNKYFSFISKLDGANAILSDIELKTNNNITDINVSIRFII
jgi:hypothetical protein